MRLLTAVSTKICVVLILIQGFNIPCGQAGEIRYWIIAVCEEQFLGF